MKATRFAYLHGFASSPASVKGTALKKAFHGRGLVFRTPDLNRPSFPRLSPGAMLDALDAMDATGEQLGAVAYFLLAGRPVFRGGVVEVLGHHLHTTPTPLAALGVDVDPAFGSVIMRCLEKDPSARFASAEALRDALAGCADAGVWTRDEARAWWTDHGAEVVRARDGARTPSLLTVARFPSP